MKRTIHIHRTKNVKFYNNLQRYIRNVGNWFNTIGIFCIVLLVINSNFFVSKSRNAEVLTKWRFRMILFLKISDFVAALSHILHNCEQKKVNLSLKMQKPITLIDNVKQFSNFMT